MRILDLALRLLGSSSGETILRSAAAASGAITLPAGTTDFSATGGAGQVVKQASAGAPFTVGTIPIADVAGAAPLASPSFTGDPQAPTPATADNDTSIATTAFVKAQAYLTVSGISGMTAGQIPIAATATTITSSGNLSGAVTTSGSLATTLANNAVATAHITNANVTYAKIQNVANNRLLGNTSGSAAAPSEIVLPLAVANGGTNAITAAAALTSLGAAPLASPTFTGTVTAPTVVGTSTITTTQLQGFNATFDGTNWRYLLGGPSYAAGLNHDPSSGSWSLGITNSTGLAGAVATITARLIADRTGACSNTTGSWSAISDVSAKTDVRPYERGLKAIMALRPVTFRYNERSPFGADDVTTARYGLIADEVQPHIPEAIGTILHDEVELSTLDSGRLIYVLINAVQELSAKIAALEGREPAA